MKKNLTSVKHFELFKKEALLWIDRLGLKDWQVRFFHEDDTDLGNCRAWFHADFSNKISSLGLARSWGDDPVSNQRVKRSGFHEVVHLLLANLVILGQERWSVQGVYETEEHVIVRRMENAFYGPESKDKAKV